MVLSCLPCARPNRTGAIKEAVKDDKGTTLRDKNAVLMKFIAEVAKFTTRDQFKEVVGNLTTKITGTAYTSKSLLINHQRTPPNQSLTSPQKPNYSRTSSVSSQLPDTPVYNLDLILTYLTTNESSSLFTQQNVTRGATYALYVLCLIYRLKAGGEICEQKSASAKEKFIYDTINMIFQVNHYGSTSNTESSSIPNTSIPNTPSGSDLGLNRTYHGVPLKFKKAYFDDCKIILSIPDTRGNKPVSPKIQIDNKGYNYESVFSKIVAFEQKRNYYAKPKVAVLSSQKYVVRKFKESKAPKAEDFSKLGVNIIINDKHMYWLENDQHPTKLPYKILERIARARIHRLDFLWIYLRKLSKYILIIYLWQTISI